MNAAAQTVSPWAQVLKEGIEPNLERIVSLWDAGHIAVLFFEVDTRRQGFVKSACVEFLGWKGRRVAITRMTSQARTRCINAIGCAYRDLDAVARWLRQPRRSARHRLLVFVHEGMLCLNFDADAGGFIPEPETPRY